MKTEVEDALRQWKTDAWKAPAMVATYLHNVSDEHGKNRLKNYIECSLCDRHSVGNEILDVGIGTGRASLPLARKGKHVTGIDSSESMLEVTRKLAGDLPVRLLPGDVEKLPFPDAAFDTSMALNVVVHFRAWEKIMGEMLRVVRPGGRVIFDIYSLDHELTADICSGGKTAYKENPADFQNFLCRVKAEDVAREATRQGATLHALVPFNPFSGASRWPGLIGNNRWLRMLSWFHEDESFFECARFLEEDIIGRLSAALAPKIMVVLEKRADPEANAAWLENYRRMERTLAQGASADSLAPFLGTSAEALRAAFGAHASDPRSRALLYRVWKYLHAIGFVMRPHNFFPPETAERFWEWHLQDEDGSRLSAFLKEWRDL
ncbi:MAG TPA: class I SAM-dependent methyltransferase, partial [Fibrobacteria bacterium]|nr:class I SAM-dependent methyltransferase [Fibrobacteria bacterium]